MLAPDNGGASGRGVCQARKQVEESWGIEQQTSVLNISSLRAQLCMHDLSLTGKWVAPAAAASPLARRAALDGRNSRTRFHAATSAEAFRTARAAELLRCARHSSSHWVGCGANSPSASPSPAGSAGAAAGSSTATWAATAGSAAASRSRSMSRLAASRASGVLSSAVRMQGQRRGKDA